MKKRSQGSLGRGLSAILGSDSNKKEDTQINSLAKNLKLNIYSL